MPSMLSWRGRSTDCIALTNPPRRCSRLPITVCTPSLSTELHMVVCTSLSVFSVSSCPARRWWDRCQQQDSTPASGSIIATWTVSTSPFSRRRGDVAHVTSGRHVSRRRATHCESPASLTASGGVSSRLASTRRRDSSTTRATPLRLHHSAMCMTRCTRQQGRSPRGCASCPRSASSRRSQRQMSWAAPRLSTSMSLTQRPQRPGACRPTSLCSRPRALKPCHNVRALRHSSSSTKAPHTAPTASITLQKSR
mmetsp:Transcript_27835/g.46304  ORF Transcript_27835/g.46304 Transcript_27835/m.46304 type:complete len:252 (-) Transcript_27835:1121-1876(-)